MKLTGFETNKINSDMVNHPSHYNLPNRKECIDEMIDIYGLKDVAKWCEITAHELKSKRKWKIFDKIVYKFMPMFLKGLYAWIILFCLLYGILFADRCSMVVSIVFLVLACIAESVLKENEDN